MANWAARGPGIICENASPSRYSSSVIQPREIKSRCMYPASAIGPPKPDEPRRRKYPTSSQRPTCFSCLDSTSDACFSFTSMSFLRVGFIQSRFQAAGKLLRFVIPPEVEKEEPGRLIKHMAVDGRDSYVMAG